MRFPNLSDLDREQRRIYAEAPSDGAILVTGAPGTGKTIMAFHRAHKLRQLGQRPQIAMFSRVLKEYTSVRSEVAQDVPVSTMHQWVDAWWKGITGVAAPRLVDSKFDFDWQAMCANALCLQGKSAIKLQWGHLLIDEGQDFPNAMYLTLGLISSQSGTTGANLLTVFADDNQRLQVMRNSETEEIRKHLLITGDSRRNYNLRRNFRNTQEIARFAAHFRVHQEVKEVELPERKGEKPETLLCDSDSQMVQYIARRVRVSPGRQIGIIVNGSSRSVQQMFNKVSHALKGHKAKVQMYLNTAKGTYRQQLDFDTPESVTVLHQNSAKGLEFDIVFYVGLEKIDLSTSGGVNERMALYVMASRARSALILLFSNLDPTGPLPSALALFPSMDSDLTRYGGIGLFDDSLAVEVIGRTFENLTMGVKGHSHG